MTGVKSDSLHTNCCPQQPIVRLDRPIDQFRPRKRLLQPTRALGSQTGCLIPSSTLGCVDWWGNMCLGARPKNMCLYINLVTSLGGPLSNITRIHANHHVIHHFSTTRSASSHGSAAGEKREGGARQPQKHGNTASQHTPPSRLGLRDRSQVLKKK